MSENRQSDSKKQPEKFHLLGSLLSSLTIAGLVLTAITFNASNHWLADLISQFRVQLALGAAVVFLLLALQRRWKFAVLCLVGCLINVYPIVPYMIPPGPAEESGMRLRLFTVNVLTNNRNWSELVELIQTEDPDFVVLMEVDSSWEQAMSSLNESYPYSRFRSRSDNFGIAFLSKHPWSEIEVFGAGKYSLPSIDVRFDDLRVAEQQVFPLRILATHPIPPMNHERWEARNQQLKNVAARLDESTANIFTGDFNLAPWSPMFNQVCEEGGLRDSAVGFGAMPTWHIFPTFLGGLKLDHILISEQLLPLSHRIGPQFGSDHLPVILDFDISLVK